jgi:hypothetical protein
MRLTTLPRRLATGALLLCTAAGLAACSDSGTPTAAGTATPAGTATATPAIAVSGSPVASPGASGGACALLTAADVKSAISENVTGSTSSGGASANDGSTVTQCVLSTDGPALLGGQAQSILAFVAGLAGQQPQIDLKTGGIAVIKTVTATPVTAAATGAPLPTGAAAASGFGKSAYSIPSPTGGGIAVSQVSDTVTVIVVDLEGKKVTADQLTTLLKAAVNRA